MSRPVGPSAEDLAAARCVEVDEHLNRVNTAQAISEAVSFSSAGRYHEASSTLEHALRQLKVSYSAGTSRTVFVSLRADPLVAFELEHASWRE